MDENDEKVAAQQAEKLKHAAAVRQMAEDLNEAQLRDVLTKLMLHREAGREWMEFCRSAVEKEWRPADPEGMEYLHIAPDVSTGGSLKQAFRTEIEREQQRVAAWRDHLACGPLTGVEQREGWLRRLAWLGQMHGSDDLDGMRDLDKGYREITELPGRVSADTGIVIWAAGNAAEQIALRWLLFLFREFTGSVYVIDAPAVTAGLTGRSDAVFLKSGELSADKLRSVWERAVQTGLAEYALTGQRRRQMESEWEVLSAGKHTLHRYGEGRIVGVPEDYYDAYLLETAKKVCGRRGEYRKAARVIGEALGQSEEPLDDSFLNHRLSSLVYAGRLEFKGVPRQMRMYEVRPAASGSAGIGRAAGSREKSAEELAQRQLDRYNAHDLEGFLDVYAEDARLYNLLDGSLIAEGRDAMRERYRRRFEVDKVHAELVNRMVIGSRVIDHEQVTQAGSDRATQAAAIYETAGGLIREVWFVYE
ncbi:DUF3658 domain-containing protein [Saccharibacillus alkalitolerans]|uniref:DUF1835 domain-containing protein n=1 Tax=Saccharibacillus alkalitolerans TaxID=2705290 RepID=A0ABX0F9N6_9BACL|nr:DUF3658 domain-containing protein [Saccharibacillus alkalitolerans]NGZ76278.1 DUF1835 domain-containing protein [Saccharibacillus alkalitolerans]